MTCPKCGYENNESSSFCVKCGANLKELKNEDVKEEKEEVATEKKVKSENSSTTSESTNMVGASTKKANASTNYLKSIIAFFIAPFKGFKDNEEKLEDTKMSLIISGGTAVLMMLVNLLISMINAIFAKTFDYSTYSFKTKIDFSRLGKLDYGSLIFKNLLIYAGIIAAVAVIYFLFAMLFKKKASYVKLLSSTALSLLPVAVGAMFVAPILGMIWTPFAVVISIASIVYSVTIFVTLVNDQVKMDDKNNSIYYHALSITVLLVAEYYILINVLLSGITKDVTNALNLLS